MRLRPRIFLPPTQQPLSSLRLTQMRRTLNFFGGVAACTLPSRKPNRVSRTISWGCFTEWLRW